MARCEHFPFDVDALIEESEALEAKLAMTTVPCVWEEDQDGCWSSACGLDWAFNDDGPEENQCSYCPKCGHPLQAVPWVEPEEEAD